MKREPHHQPVGRDPQDWQSYTVGELAKLSGVSVRTLHHYDAIGLLPPQLVRPNGYRLYRRVQLLRLQEILFYREIGMRLGDIAALLDGPDDAVERLSRHREVLAAQAKRRAQMLETLDATIAHLKGNRSMTPDDLYAPFPPEKQEGYEAWLVETYGASMTDAIARSKTAVADLPDGMEGAMDRLKSIESRLVEAFEAEAAADKSSLHDLLEEHRALMGDFWGRPCDADGVEGLADMYLSHPDFVARYERLSPRFSQWLPAAMKAHAQRLRHQT